MRSRLLGMGMIAAGLAIAWFSIAIPFQQAQAQAPEVSYGMKAFFAAGLTLAVGLALLIGGDRVGAAYATRPETKEQHMLVWPVFAAGITISIIGYYWFDSQMTSMGYGG